MKHALRNATLSAALLSLGLAAGAMAQTPSTGTSSKATTPPSSSSTMSSSTAKSGSEAKVDKADRKFMEKAAEGGMTEVELGKLATQKAGSDQVKQFGQRMVDDHGKANDQLKQLAASKGVELPTDLSKSDKREMDKLSKLSGADFDREYMKHMVSDHKKDVSDFKKEAKSAKDADVKSFASSTEPTLEQHLQLAESTQAAVRNEGKGNTAKTSMAPGTTSASSMPGNSGATTGSTGSSAGKLTTKSGT